MILNIQEIMQRNKAVLSLDCTARITGPSFPVLGIAVESMFPSLCGVARSVRTDSASFRVRYDSRVTA